MRRAEAFLPTIVGLIVVFLFSLLLYFTPGPLRRFVDFLQRAAYDWQVTHYHRRLPENSPILIVDIDDESLYRIGRWPWNRSVMADLVSRLYEGGAKVISFDVMFPEQSEKGEDEQFARALTKGASVLGFAFQNSEDRFGELSHPLFKVTEGVGLQIAEKNGYLTSTPTLGQAAKGEGFLNASPDADGVLRFSPLLLRYKENVFGSVGLMSVYYYLNSPSLSLLSGLYHGEEVLEALLMGNRRIPMDSSGKILIPFRGVPYSFSYVSASDVLAGKVKKDQLNEKMVFIGSSATALGDLYPTAIYPIFSGVEVHATIAQGILDGYLPYRPAWGQGAAALTLFLFGTIAAYALPRGNLATRVLLAVGLASFLLLCNETIWSSYGIVLSMVFPISTIGILFLMNLIWGYFHESRRRQQIRALFSQYLPNERIDQILLSNEAVELSGEDKELTVIFADIRGFTEIAEIMDAPKLKQTLADFFTPMTEVIFKHHGTIDKYVGDLVMAFWGAPLEDGDHPLHAVETALEMQTQLNKLDEEWKSIGKPVIQMGIGINTGVMSVGDMGSRFRKAYTVLGDPVNLASRLEGLSKYYKIGIVVGESTVAKTSDLIAYRKLDRVRVLGKKIAVEIFEPLGTWQEISESEKSKIEKSKKALDAYFAKNWDLAESLFSELRAASPTWAEKFLKRIKQFRVTPPPANWDGAFDFDTKD